MAEGYSLINFGELSRPATVLIEKVSDAVGGIAKPGQIKRVAQAEAEAEKIRAQANIEISEMQERGLARMIREQGQHQENIEDITAKAIPRLSDDAKPEDIGRDWLAFFFDRCRLISDEEMQSLWSRILADEANKPGAFSKQTIELVGVLDKEDANMFTKLCTFSWVSNDIVPVGYETNFLLVYDLSAASYTRAGIEFAVVNHLEDLGLVTFDIHGDYAFSNLSKYITVFYHGRPLQIKFPEIKNDLDVGSVLLTRAGQELAPICGANRSEEHYSYVISKWSREGLVLTSPTSTEDSP